MWPWRKQKAATIGAGVRIRGRVESEGDLELAGEVHGDVDVAGALVLRSTARLYGDIRCAALQIEQGAVFAGTNRMGSAGTPARLAPPAFDAAPASGFAPAPARAPGPAAAPAPSEPAEAPLAILMAPVGQAEREMLGVMPKAESPAFFGGFNSAIKGA